MVDLNKKILSAIREEQGGTVELEDGSANFLEVIPVSFRDAFGYAVACVISLELVSVGLANYCA